MLDERLANRPIDFDQSIDDGWLNRCNITQLGQDGELSYFRLHDPVSRQAWIAVRAPLEAPAACQRLERDYRLQLDPQWAVIPSAFVRCAEGPLLVYPTGRSIADLISEGPVDLPLFFDIAVNAADALAQAHERNVLHGALQPEHVCLQANQRVRLGCFRADTPELISEQGNALGNWAYLAPEQICPHGSSSDRRSDIYALGAILYQLLLGELPLAGRDAQHWRQLHAGVQPRSACEVDSQVPLPLSRILAKALAKEPDARYQSARALAVDLAHCQRQWTASKTIAPFEPGCADPVSPSRERLYGRTAEQKLIALMLDTQRRDSKPQVLFINGAAGLGKSSLVEATLKAHAEGYWAVGKCNSPDQAVPYAPWVEILGSLTTQLLAKNSQDLDTLRREILQRIEGHGRLLGKLAPDLQLILGPLPELPEKPTRLALHKEQRAIVEFLQVFSYPGHPLVLCFDGLQGADDGTRQLLAQLLAQAPDNLLLIVTRRNDTPTAGVPLAVPVALRSTTLNLRPLDVGAVTELISERYHVSPDEALQVAGLVHDKTAGNPFFINQILKAMVEDRLFTFDTQAMRWSWCLQAVARQRYADNVADLMIHRLARLPAPQRDVLRVASAAGSRCNERLLHLLLVPPPDKPLKALIDMGFLLPGQKGLSFAHDRVMEAAYQLTPTCDRAQLHARIAQAMLQVWHNDLQEVVFEIASQLQRASPRGFAADERDVFLQLLREAALRSRDSGACEQSAAHLQVCEQLLIHGATPQSHATHAFAIACMAAECDLQLSRMAAAQGRLIECLQRACSPLDRARVCKLQARLHTLRGDYQAAITTAVAGLELLGISLARGVAPQQVEASHAQVEALIEQKGRHCLASLPRTDSEEVAVAIGLLATLSSSFFVQDDIRFLHLTKLMELSLLQGVAPGSTYGLAWYGVMIADRFGNYHDGHACCLAALKLIERHGFEADLTSALLALDRVSAWTSPMEFARRTALEAIDSTRLSGDLAMTCHACNHLVSDSLFMGRYLPQVAEEVVQGLATVRSFGYSDIEQILHAQQGFVASLSGMPGTASPLHVQSPTTLFFQHLFNGMSAFYLGDIAQAMRSLSAAGDSAWAAPAHINLADYHLFRGLALGSPEAPGRLADKLAVLQSLRERFSRWACFNPVTFRNKLLLIEGVIAKLEGDGLTAIRCFDQAQIAATAAGFIHEQALAHEQLAEVCIPSGLISGANLHLRIARDCFHIWGATGKVHQLEALHPFLRTQPVQETHRATQQAKLDLEAGIEAARALSEEVLLEGLIETLMGHLTQHSGADHGALLIVSGAEFQMAALAYIDDAGLHVNMDNCQKFMTQAPRSIINATMRTKKPLVLNDAQSDCPEAFRQELHTRNARSVLCLPLVIQGVLIGLVYLENRLVPNLFGSQRLAMLEILASQAAVSLQTAKLYTRLAEDNQVRAQMEEELRRSRAELARSAHLQVMNELSASIAHEISQPLLGIASNAAASLRWLKRAEPNLEEAMAGLEDIRNDSERAANIVRALRSLAKQAPMQLKVVKVDELIREVLRLTSADAAKYTVDVQTQLQAGVSVMADPVQLQQLVFNLITNALEALAGYRSDGVLRIASVVTGDGIEICVDDNGPGIAAEERARVFDPFHTTKQAGLGMGLAICSSVVQAHGGQLQALVSEFGGCRIRFTLPVSSS
ncbi:AAA family ATPase [Pseudomonas vlassakiae]|uniref:trifunctional serine/threonine-protein kinase/ATP-binding protein/sensor histidine kinase n=2 Tax=Pseudomonas TaxID=286 RepID=UPI000C1A2ECA|nr:MULTISPECIES: ATP-binding sensor histidine kinase [unclassified Pseudomonas]AXQ50278.1 GAF domain-containing protein [Stenotrophomonas rhizophila]MBS3187538.1 AAA family ATPase [Pseudomonas sp. PCH44]PIK80078.1 histidine kinase [Pseudomonas sp. 382]